MLIKPIDYINSISKSQDVAKVNQLNDDRINIQFQYGINQEEKKVAKNLNKVRDTNKSETKIIDNNRNDKENYKSNNKKKHRKYEDKYNIQRNNNRKTNSIDIKV